jgi:NAD(P)-dependent dehydrogenase (short-subunit alcohol dehydrogenase family)
LEFAGKVALVTGAGSGVGEAAAHGLAAAGARVGLLDIRPDRVGAVAEAIRSAGGEAIALPATEIADEAQVAAAVEALAAATGRLDIVVANAGINGVWAPIDELQPQEWERTIAVNLRGTYLTLHFAVPHLKRAGGGAIVIVASINGTRSFTSPGATAYGASKAAQVAIGNQLALELARHRIRVNTVAPGSTRTNLFESTSKRNVGAARIRATFPDGDVPLTDGQPAEAADVADAILMLCSERSRHVTGTLVYVDGGQSLLR